MNDPRKLPLLKSAFHLLIEQLRDCDRVALVVYAGNAGLVLDSISGREKTLLPTHSTAWKREVQPPAAMASNSLTPWETTASTRHCPTF